MTDRPLMKLIYRSSSLDHRSSPIATLLFTGNVRDALRHAAKELRKRPDSLILQTLHSYALFRLNRIDQALECLETISANPALLANESILVFISSIFFGCGLPDKSSALYDLIQSKNPDSYSSAITLCEYAIRSGDSSRMTLSSRRLFKISEKNLSLWWCILSHIIHALASKSPQETALSLSVADRYANNQGAIPKTSHEFYVIARLRYVKAVIHLDYSSLDLFPFRTLPASQRPKRLSISTETGPQLLEKFPQDEKARKSLLEFISSPAAVESFAKDLGIELWKRHVYLTLGTVSDWKSTFDNCIQLLNNGDRNWATIGTLTRLAVKLQKNSESMVSEDCDSESLNFAKTAISFLTETFTNILAAKAPKPSVSDRGIVLGLIDLATYAVQNTLLPDPTVIKYLEQYIDAYAERVFCWSDIESYITSLSPLNRDLFRDIVTSKISENKAFSGKGDPFVTFFKIQCALRQEDLVSVEVNLQEAQNFASRYYMFQNKQDPTESDLQTADEYALLVAHMYIIAWSKSKDNIHLYRAAAFLNISKSDFNERFLPRLLLVAILRLFCAPGIAKSIWTDLSIKNTQIDTLSHLLLDRSNLFPTQEAHLDDFLDVINWYYTGTDEASECTEKAWNGESYSQIEDFLEFSNRLTWSLTRAITYFDYHFLSNTLALYDPSTRPDAKFTIRILTMFLNRCETDSIYNNRDCDSFPNLISLEGPTVYDLTSFGPRRGKKWLVDFSKAYIYVLDPNRWVERQTVYSEENTESEKRLLEFMYNLAGLLHCVSKGESGDSYRESLQNYFTVEQEKLININENPHTPSQLIQNSKQIYTACSLVKRVMRDHLNAEETGNNSTNANVNAANSKSDNSKSLISTFKTRNELLKWFKNKLVKEHAKITLEKVSKIVKESAPSSPSHAAEEIYTAVLEDDTVFPEHKAHATKTLISKILVDQATFIKNTSTTIQKVNL